MMVLLTAVSSCEGSYLFRKLALLTNHQRLVHDAPVIMPLKCMSRKTMTFWAIRGKTSRFRQCHLRKLPAIPVSREHEKFSLVTGFYCLRSCSLAAAGTKKLLERQ